MLRGTSLYVILYLWKYAAGHALSSLNVQDQPRPKLADECHKYPPQTTTQPPNMTIEEDVVCNRKLHLLKDPKMDFAALKGVYYAEDACFFDCLVDCCFKLLDVVFEKRRLDEMYIYINRIKRTLGGIGKPEALVCFIRHVYWKQIPSSIDKKQEIVHLDLHFYYYCENKQDDPQCQKVLEDFLLDYYRSLVVLGHEMDKDLIPKYSGLNYAYIIECDKHFEGYQERLCKYMIYMTPWIYHMEPGETVQKYILYKRLMEANNSFCSSQRPDGDFTIEEQFQLPCYILLGSQTGERNTFLTEKEFDNYCGTFVNGIPNGACKSAYATCLLKINDPDLETNVKKVSGVEWKRPTEYCGMVVEAYDIGRSLVGHTKTTPDQELLKVTAPRCNENVAARGCRTAVRQIMKIKPNNELHFYLAACDSHYKMCDYFTNMYTTQPHLLNNLHSPFNARCLNNGAKHMLCQSLSRACKKLKSPGESCKYILRLYQHAQLMDKKVYSCIIHLVEEAHRYLSEFCDIPRSNECTDTAKYIAGSKSNLKLLSDVATKVCTEPTKTSTHAPDDNSKPNGACTAYLKAVVRAPQAERIYEETCNVNQLASHIRVCNLFYDICREVGKDRGICNTIDADHKFLSAFVKVGNKTVDDSIPVIRTVCRRDAEDSTCIRLTNWLQTERDFSSSLYKAVCASHPHNMCYATLKAHFEKFNATFDDAFMDHCSTARKALDNNGTCTAIARYCERENVNADCYPEHISKCRRHHVFAQDVCGPLADIYCAGEKKHLERCDEFFKEMYMNQNERIRLMILGNCAVALPKGNTLSSKCKSFLQVDIDFNKGLLVKRMYQEFCSSKKVLSGNGNICQIINSICDQSSRTCKGIIEMFDLQQVCKKEVDDECKKALETYCIDERNEDKMGKCDALLKEMPVQTMLDAYKFECIERGNGKVCARTQFQVLNTGRILRLFDEYCRVWLLSGKCREIRTICKETEIKYQDCNTVMRPYYIIGGISLVGLAIGLVLICVGAGLFIWEFNNQSEVMEEVVEKASSTSICEPSEREDADPDDTNDMTMTLGEGEEGDWEDELEGVEGDEEPAPDPTIAQDLDDYEDEFGYTSLGGAAVQAAIEREAADAAAAAQQAAAELAAQQAAEQQPPADPQYVAIQQAPAVQQPPAQQTP